MREKRESLFHLIEIYFMALSSIRAPPSASCTSLCTFSGSGRPSVRLSVWRPVCLKAIADDMMNRKRGRSRGVG